MAEPFVDWRSSAIRKILIDGRFISCKVIEGRKAQLLRLMPWVLLVIHDVPDSMKAGIATCLGITSDEEQGLLAYVLRVLKRFELITRDVHGWKVTTSGLELANLLRGEETPQLGPSGP